MNVYKIAHFNKPFTFGGQHAGVSASQYVVEAHNLRNAMRRLWEDHRVNLNAGDLVYESTQAGDFLGRTTIQ